MYPALMQILPTLDPLDPEQRLAAIEAVRRIIRRYQYTPDLVQKLSLILMRYPEHKRWEMRDYFPSPLPFSMSQEEIAQCFQGRRLTMDDPVDRALFYRHLLHNTMLFSTCLWLFQWLYDHRQAATPAEVDLLVSLHDEFLRSDVCNDLAPPSTPRIYAPWTFKPSDAWAGLLRVLAPDRALEIAKSTPDGPLCCALTTDLPGGYELFKARFPNWSEDEKRREREFLDTLHDDDFP
ncbi:hypothetical protein L6R46_14725 [Myxococcota bacterium]|nr:hypothetical protein [Myxococcota bacterium]